MMIKVSCRRCDGSGELDCDCESDYGNQWNGECNREHPCGNCRGTGKSAVVYANVYAVTRHWGGPEEGGWWYNLGTPLGSVRVDPSWEPEPIVQLLKALYEDENEGNIYHSTGGQQVEVCFENHFAEVWPDRRPRYE